MLLCYASPVSSGDIGEENGGPSNSVSVETAYVRQSGISDKKYILEEFIAFTWMRDGGIIKVKIKIVVIKLLSEGSAPAGSG